MQRENRDQRTNAKVNEVDLFMEIEKDSREVESESRQNVILEFK